VKLTNNDLHGEIDHAQRQLRCLHDICLDKLPPSIPFPLPAPPLNPCIAGDRRLDVSLSGQFTNFSLQLSGLPLRGDEHQQQAAEWRTTSH